MQRSYYERSEVLCKNPYAGDICWNRTIFNHDLALISNVDGDLRQALIDDANPKMLPRFFIYPSQRR